MLPSVIRVCCASLFLLFETLELRLALLAAYTQIAWRLFVCLCRGLFSSLSLSLFTCLFLSSALLLSPIQSVRRPPLRHRDLRRVAIAIHRVMLPCQQSVHFFFRCFPFSPSAWRSVWLRRRQLATAEAAERAPARTRPISPKARSEWEPLPLGKLLLLLLRSFSWRPP